MKYILFHDLKIQGLESSNHEIVCISLEQMHSFSGNVLEVISNGGEKLMLMSSSAEKALTDSQYKTISKYCRIVSSPIDNIEASILSMGDETILQYLLMVLY